MTEKYECEGAIFARLKRTAFWRESVAKRFPADGRNQVAADMLRKMTNNVTLSDQQWARLAVHFDRSERWSEAAMEASRRVGIKPGVNDFELFVNVLTDLLEGAAFV